MGNVDKAPEVSGKEEAMKQMEGVMPPATELGKDSPEVKRQLTIEDLKKEYPACKKVVSASEHGDIVKICRNKIREENNEHAKRSGAKAAPISPGDNVRHDEKVYNPGTGKLTVTPYAYGVGTNGENLLLMGESVTREPTKAEQTELGIESGGESLRWAESSVKNPEPIPAEEGEKILNAIAKAGGDRIRRDEDNLAYSKDDLKAVGIDISYGAFYAVQLKGKKHFYKGTGIKG